MEQLLFIKNSVKDFYRVGAVAPSSRFLAERMARATLINNAQTIIELGAGTGAITKELLKILPLQGRITILEINPDFVSFLEKNRLMPLSLACRLAISAHTTQRK